MVLPRRFLAGLRNREPQLLSLKRRARLVAGWAQAESADDPACGVAPRGDVASRLVVVATNESGRSTRRFACQAEAITYAQALIAAGRDYDVGLMQINPASSPAPG